MKIEEPTMSPIANPFVHFIKMPDEMEVCFTGKEKVKPRPPPLSNGYPEPYSSLSTNCLNTKAIKSKRSCKQYVHTFTQVVQ